MAEETNAAATAGTTGTGGVSAPPAAPGAGASGGSSAAPQSDDQILESLAEKPSGAAPDPAAPAETKPAEAAPEINLDALKEAQPEWLSKVTDEGAKAEITKLLAAQEKFSKLFKDDADYDAFSKELPGGREQITALQKVEREVEQLDGHIATNTPESNAIVVGRYLGEAPDKGVGLFRAGANHLAANNPDGWRDISNELVDASLKAVGLPVSFGELTQIVEEMKAGLRNADQDEGLAFGRAAGKLLGAPKAEARPDPATERQKAEREAAQRDANAARTETWNVRVERTHNNATSHIRQLIGQSLAVKVNGVPLISDVISQEARDRLADAIYRDVDSQLMADPWFVSQLTQLIGNPKSPLLTAKKEDFEKALELNKARVAKLLTPAMIKKHVETWSKDVVAKSNGALERAKGAAARGDNVGGAPAPGSGGSVRPLIPEALAKLSPEERDDAILAQLSR